MNHKITSMSLSSLIFITLLSASANAQHKLEASLRNLERDTVEAPATQQNAPSASLRGTAQANSDTLRITLTDSLNLEQYSTIWVNPANGNPKSFGAINSTAKSSTSSNRNIGWEDWKDDGWDDDNWVDDWENNNWDWNWTWGQKRHSKREKRFKAYAFKALEWGINGFADGYSPVLRDELQWLDLRQARSWNFNINVVQLGLGLGTRYVGLVTGMGLMFNNYHFSDKIRPVVVNGITVADSSLCAYPMNKNKIQTFGLGIPLLLEFNIPIRHNTLFFAVGAIGEVRLHSKTKVEYSVDGDEKKIRDNNDLNISTLKYSLTARMGTEDIYLFCNYSPMSFFEPGKGPTVNTFSIGLGLVL